MEMVGACRVEDDPVRRIGRHDRRETKHPDGKPLERFGIRLRIGVLDRKAWHQYLRLRYRHAGAQADGEC